MEYDRPFRGQALVQRIGPFAAIATVAFVVALVPVGEVRVGRLAVAVGVNLVAFAVGLLLSTERFPPALDVVPALVYLVAIAVMRDALGGSVSGYDALILLPVVWVAVYGTTRHVALVLAGVGVVLFLPLLVVGGDRYPAAAWRPALLWAAIAPGIGFAVHELIERIRSLVSTDETTGLHNPQAILRELARECARYRRDNERLSIAVLDVDGLAAMNERIGYERTDRYLAECADRWRSCLRVTDAIGRLQDDAFLLVLPACFVEHASWVVDRLVDAMPRGATCSAGVVAWNGHDSEERLIGIAFELVRRAKQRGPGMIAVGADAAIASA